MGRISSIETMGLVDGPGIRFVTFLQGCPNRCIFCHNPETWESNKGYDITSEELVSKVERYKNYFGDIGGITFSGGEPLLQPNFLIDTMKLCKEKGINVCLDTSGVGVGKYEEILKNTDLVMYDIKALDSDKYSFIVKNKIEESLKFLDICQKLNKRMWIRQVIIPGINDNEEYIKELAQYISKLNNIEKVELLPYHDMAKTKYKELKINYSLESTPNMDIDRCKDLQDKLIIYIKDITK